MGTVNYIFWLNCVSHHYAATSGAIVVGVSVESLGPTRRVFLHVPSRGQISRRLNISEVQCASNSGKDSNVQQYDDQNHGQYQTEAAGNVSRTALSYFFDVLDGAEFVYILVGPATVFAVKPALPSTYHVMFDCILKQFRIGFKTQNLHHSVLVKSHSTWLKI